MMTSPQLTNLQTSLMHEYWSNYCLKIQNNLDDLFSFAVMFVFLFLLTGHFQILIEPYSGQNKVCFSEHSYCFQFITDIFPLLLFVEITAARICLVLLLKFVRAVVLALSASVPPVLFTLRPSSTCLLCVVYTMVWQNCTLLRVNWKQAGCFFVRR